MTPPSGKKEESRARILASAGRGFRGQGFGGLGVDGLAKAAGVTSGAFYAHFKSKAEAFREAVRAGMGDLAAGVEGFRAEGGDWIGRFVDFYLGERRRAPLAESCALQSLTGEVARADAETRAIYEAQLSVVIAALTEGAPAAPAADRRAWAIALLALLSGGVSMARAVNDAKLAEEIAAAVARTATALRPDAALE
jgi:AcrR family transcriptional regulator